MPPSSGTRRILISSQRVWDFHGQRSGRPAPIAPPILIEDGERYKNLNTVARVLDALVKAKADRSTVIIAVGGGVIGDLVGFAAATYLRGIPVVHVPTTLLAQVDSAIGGKTGVNHPLGKNLIGAFHAPSLVVADPMVLETLPRREFRAGLYEVIKYGVISEPALLDRMRDDAAGDLRARRRGRGAAGVGIVPDQGRRWCRPTSVKSGLRRILNFGHTVGHALEAATKYKRFRHGEAIGYGMLAALAIGVARGRHAEVALRGSRCADHAARSAAAGRRHLRERGARGDRPRQEGRRPARCTSSRPPDRGKTVELTDVTEKEIKAALKKIGLAGALVIRAP